MLCIYAKNIPNPENTLGSAFLSKTRTDRETTNIFLLATVLILDQEKNQIYILSPYSNFFLKKLFEELKMKNSLCLKESSNKDKVSSMFTEVQGWFCNPVNLLLALKETSFNVSETTEQVKKRGKKNPHASSSAQDWK